MTNAKYLLCAFLFSCITLPAFGQKMTLSISTDTVRNEVTTHVSLINIPQGGRVRFQQRLPAQAKLLAPPLSFLLWDTANNIFTIISPNYPKIDTLPFVFVCKMDSLPDRLLWGESALMYEDKNKQVQKIKNPARTYIIREKVKNIDSVTLQKGMFYIQVSASKSPQKIGELSKQIHLQNEHKLIERKTANLYTYLIGHFPTKASAAEILKEYKKYAKDAFIVAY